MSTAPERSEEEKRLLVRLEDIQLKNPDITQSFGLLRDLIKERLLGKDPFVCTAFGATIEITEGEDQKSINEKVTKFAEAVQLEATKRAKPSGQDPEHKTDVIRKTQKVIDELFTETDEDQKLFEERFGVYPGFAKECVDLFHDLWMVFCIDFASEGSIIFPRDFHEGDGHNALNTIKRNFPVIIREMSPFLIVDMETRREEFKKILEEGAFPEKIAKIQKLFEIMIGEVFTTKRDVLMKGFLKNPPLLSEDLESSAGFVIDLIRIIVNAKNQWSLEWNKKIQDLKQQSSLHRRLLGLIHMMDQVMKDCPPSP